MKLFSRLIISSFLVITTSSPFAAAGGGGGSDQGLSDLTTYFLNLGGYFGYNLQISPAGTTPQGTISQNLLFNQGATAQVDQTYLFNTYLGSLLVNTAAASTSPFVSTAGAASPYSAMNAFANYTFATPPYSTPAQDSVSASPLLDQPPYQADPVSQAILNILGTPDYSYCLNNDGTAVVACTYPSGTLNEYQISINTIGTIPTTQNYFTYAQVQPLLTQLNVNSLITPLLYSVQSSAGGAGVSPGSSGTPTPSANTTQGLTAGTQAQQAANFIRFATGLVSPMPMPNRNEYGNLLGKAQNVNGTYSQLEQQEAQIALATYLNNLRIFAAQSSVGVANLYYILSKRMPQNQASGTAGQQTSQALSEFTMATWRLYNPDLSANTQWLNQINNASLATVQKETAVLLAEINYQLYLSRQQQERILLTNTMLLLQNARNAPPSPNLTLPTAASGGLKGATR